MTRRLVDLLILSEKDAKAEVEAAAAQLLGVDALAVVGARVVAAREADSVHDVDGEAAGQHEVETTGLVGDIVFNA